MGSMHICGGEKDLDASTLRIPATCADKGRQEKALDSSSRTARVDFGLWVLRLASVHEAEVQAAGALSRPLPSLQL